MLDLNTFLTTVYVHVDELCQSLPHQPRRGPAPALSRSEVITLGLFSQWSRFRSERDFYRFADDCLRPYFPRLPDRSQFNRELRHEWSTLVAVGQALADDVAPPDPSSYELIDSPAAPTRNSKRRGEGWLAGLTALGKGGRGWYEGFHLLVLSAPTGVITGFGFGAANINERALAETCFAPRQQPDPALPTVGTPRSGAYFADSGFAGQDWQSRWAAAYAAVVCAPPETTAAAHWTWPQRRQLAGWRQIIETVIDRLHLTFSLDRERPHTLDGFQARVAARVAAHNLCCWLNRAGGRPLLAVADLVGWA